MRPELRSLLLSSVFMAVLLPESSSGGAPATSALRRGGHWGFRLARRDARAEVRRLDPASAAARAGLRDGEAVLALGDVPISATTDLDELLRQHRAGDPVRLQIQRDGRSRDIAFRLPPLPEESIPGCEVLYGSVTSARGYRVRTIVTRPLGATSRLPALFFVPWLSCDAVEMPIGEPDGWNHLLRRLASTSGRVVMRVEKPGCGDSEGPPCSGNDLETDLAAFRAGLEALRAMDFVDTSRIVMLGSSIGGALAPVLAAETPGVAGLIISGGFSRTWFEHMLEIERRRMTLEGKPATEIHRAIRGYADFYSLYLGQRLTPGEVIARRPDLGPLWTDAPGGQYGRPAAYYHQVATLDVEGAWERLDVPALILYGEYDWIMSRAEHEHAAWIVNRRRPGAATLEILPRTGHGLEVFESEANAFRWEGGRFDPAVADRIVQWLNRAGF